MRCVYVLRSMRWRVLYTQHMYVKRADTCFTRSTRTLNVQEFKRTLRDGACFVRSTSTSNVQ